MWCYNSNVISLLTHLGDACAAEVSADPTGGEQHASTEAEPQASPDKQPPVKTVGPLTDVDVIKLRPCEKKQVPLIFPPKLYFLKVIW